MPDFESAFHVFYAQTDSQGNYRIEGLKPGTYRAYPDSPPSGGNPGPNPYGPEIITIKANTKHDFDFKIRPLG